jgi:hypothetical protein
VHFCGEKEIKHPSLLHPAALPRLFCPSLRVSMDWSSSPARIAPPRRTPRRRRRVGPTRRVSALPCRCISLRSHAQTPRQAADPDQPHCLTPNRLAPLSAAPPHSFPSNSAPNLPHASMPVHASSVPGVHCWHRLPAQLRRSLWGCASSAWSGEWLIAVES